MKKTKIVCTLGPASTDENVMREMLLAGMNVARMNFSHGTHEDHKRNIELIKRVREKLGMPIAILLDTKGPEVRIRTFENGKIIKAESTDTERCNQIFDTDEGARYVGEFAIGVNPYITSAIKDTLFDEKIAGSIHFTPGNCYDDAYNGNHSSIHWDLVLIMTPEYGGGEIWFDDVLIRKDGLFVLPELECLNPENLK